MCACVRHTLGLWEEGGIIVYNSILTCCATFHVSVVYEQKQPPTHSLCILIGPFISCPHCQQFATCVIETLNPHLEELGLCSKLQEKAEVVRLCANVTRKLSSGRDLVYIS